MSTVSRLPIATPLGVILIEDGYPRNLHVETFCNLADAVGFLNWLGDVRESDDLRLRGLVRRYHIERHWPECPEDGCDQRVKGGGLCGCCERDADEARAS